MSRRPCSDTISGGDGGGVEDGGNDDDDEDVMMVVVGVELFAMGKVLVLERDTCTIGDDDDVVNDGVVVLQQWS